MVNKPYDYTNDAGKLLEELSRDASEQAALESGQGREVAHRSYRSYTSRRWAMRVTLISFAASSMMHTTR
jgi:hypothetical protein